MVEDTDAEEDAEEDDDDGGGDEQEEDEDALPFTDVAGSGSLLEFTRGDPFAEGDGEANIFIEEDA
jgi:hypothetical protein